MPTVEQLQLAIRFLSDRCDGAVTIDGQGFNGRDSFFGKSLANQARWTPKQAEAAVKMLRTYKKQLTRGGFDVDQLFDGTPIKMPAPPMKRTKPSANKKTAKLVDGKTVVINFPFEQKTLDIVRTIPQRRFHGDKNPKYWSAPLSIEAAETLANNEFELCPELQTFLQRAKTDINALEEIEIKGLKRELFPFQKKGVAFLEAKGGRGLIADEMGLGKTIQALAWLHLHPEARPAIILCPAHLKLNWAQEIKKTIPGRQNIQVLFGQDVSQPLTGDIIIINYDILPNKFETFTDQFGNKKKKELPGTGWVEYLIDLKPKTLIFDEAHYIKNNGAHRTKATKKLAKKIPHVIALSGTPIVNRPIEGFNIAQVVDKTVFPSFFEYARTYCDAKHNGFGWDFNGASNKEELHKKLTETIMIRRKKADVLKDLPDKIYSYVPMEISNAKEYRKAEDEFISYLVETKGEKAAKKAAEAEHLVKIEALKQLCIKGKIAQAIDWIRNFIEEDKKLVVFTTHKETVALLMKEFQKVAVKVDGSVSSSKRNEAVEAFQNNPTVKLFVGNIQAAGTGLTLTAASSVAFLELPWTPGELVQAEDRCHRIGQKNAVNVYYLLAAGTIEEDIAGLLDKKRKVLEAVLDGREVEQTQLLTELIKRYSNKGRVA